MACILVIDDDAPFRTTLRETLEQAGHAVVEARDTHAALAALQAHPIDLVITDIVMPGQGGYHVIRQVKTLTPQVKVLAMSGGNVFPAGDLLESAALIGADRILPKPLQGVVFLAAVRELLAGT
jgi:CheY-like chemotaxis protein